jgi:hypothetical protein
VAAAALALAGCAANKHPSSRPQMGPRERRVAAFARAQILKSERTAVRHTGLLVSVGPGRCGPSSATTLKCYALASQSNQPGQQQYGRLAIWTIIVTLYPDSGRISFFRAAIKQSPFSKCSPAAVRTSECIEG